MDDTLTILFAFAIAAMALSFSCGLAFLLFPVSFRAVMLRLEGWFSPAPLFEALDRPHYLEHRIYRHHKLVGILVVLAATYTLIRLTGLHGQAAAHLLPAAWGLELRRNVVQLAVTMLALSNVMALTVGIIVYFRPSLLKRGEMVANRWWWAAPALKSLDIPHDELNDWLWSHPRLAGPGMMLAATYISGILIACRYHLW